MKNRVVHLVISLHHGGLERLVVDWTNERNRRCPGSTSIICLDKPGELADEVAGDVVFCLNARRHRFPFDLATVRTLKKWLPPSDECNLPLLPSILHSHNLAAQQYACLACFGSTTRHVHTEHGTNVHVRGIKNRLRLRLLARLTDRMVAVSDDTAAKMRPVWNVQADRLKVIRNGVSAHPRFGRESVEALRRELGIPSDRIVIGSVGRLAHVKGYDRLLSALPTVLQRQVSATCLLVGDGPERPALEDMAVHFGIADRVVFAGYCADARKFLEVMDLFVLPSRSEGLSVALLEAMAAGLPVAVTPVGENPRVVEDGQTGFFLSDDEKAWGDSLIGLLEALGAGEPAGRTVHAVGEAARKAVLEHFSIENTLAAYEELYTAML